jgi:hypothetical protein
LLLVRPCSEIEGSGVEVDERAEHDRPQPIDRDRLSVGALQGAEEAIVVADVEGVALI